MSNSFKAALWTALFAFVATAGLALTTLLGAVSEYVAGNDTALADGWSVFAKVIMSAFIAGVSGLVNWVVRAAQARGVLPGNGPTYTDTGDSP